MFDLDRWEEIWQTINRNRKRSIMTAFGVFWGIFMLTVMMGSGLGLRNLLYANLNGMNENSVMTIAVSAPPRWLIVITSCVNEITGPDAIMVEEAA